MTIVDDRRLKIVSIPENHVIDSFIGATRGFPSHVVLPLITGLPTDVRVHRVTYDFYRKCFAFMVSHPSFEEVPESQLIPDFVGPLNLQWQWLELATAADKASVVTG